MIHRSNVESIRALSGIPYFMTKALQRHVGDVINLSSDTSFVTRAIEVTGKIANRVSYAGLGHRLSSDHHRILSKRLASVFGPRVAQSGCDVIFAPVASVEIADLAIDVPIVYYSDLNWANIVDYYPGCSSLFKFMQSEGERVEAAALRRAAALIYPSKWAIETAIHHYGIDSRRIHLVPCGANFETRDVPAREEALTHSLADDVTLLWIGIDWERKGGAIAHECLMELLNRGVDARLIVCGCIPPASFHHARMEVIPFLSKTDPAQRRQLSRLFLRANFFIFPTQAEAFGIVLCEASAHGLPSLVRNTGGVGGAIREGENGFLMPADARGGHYADKIMELQRAPEVYDRLVRSSRAAYEERLNWDAWGRTVGPIFEHSRRECHRRQAH